LCENGEAQSGFDDVLVDVQKKGGRLWRKTVSPARLNMEPIKIADCLATAADEHAHIAAFCFANRAADWAVEAFGQFINVTAQIQCMPVECRG
jgi:hypothetical protein